MSGPHSEHDLQTARELYSRGEIDAVRALLGQVEADNQDDAVMLQEAAEIYAVFTRHEDAARCLERAVELVPEDPGALYNLATARIALGRIEAAEALLSKVIALSPNDYDAWYNRSTLRTQTRESNHVEPLRRALAGVAPGDEGRIPLCYALAKELEDLGCYAESFSILQQGATDRRKRLSYAIEKDEETLAAIADEFDASRLERKQPVSGTRRPIFVLGLPRSGTTLVERIIASHSGVESVGEANMLALALVNTAGQTRDKTDLVKAAARLDFGELGRRYLRALDGFGRTAPRLVDKTPLNFLYLGLIRLALPNAKIVHVSRHPVDSCYAMYKTLFRMGYPFSYSLQDTGRYYIAYHRLMRHWRRCMPGAFLDVAYEDLVADPPGQTRRMLDYLDLEWEDECLQFHRLESASATASAAQVRQPIYRTSVGKWQCYAQQLAPFCRQMQAHGISLDN